MTTTTSRRAVLAGAVALPALALRALAMSDDRRDPIFAVIERHKVEFRAFQEAGLISSNTVDNKLSPKYDPIEHNAAEEAYSATYDAAADAAYALATIRPTTIAGVLALIRHVEAFNAGTFVLDVDPANWFSGPIDWPTDNDDEIDLFGYSILANVRSALEALAVQS